MKENKGYIMVLALIVASACLLYTLILTVRIFVQRRQVDYSYSREKALALAESGVDAGLATLNQIGPSSPFTLSGSCLLYTSPSPRDLSTSRMPSSA